MSPATMEMSMHSSQKKKMEPLWDPVIPISEYSPEGTQVSLPWRYLQTQVYCSTVYNTQYKGFT